MIYIGFIGLVFFMVLPFIVFIVGICVITFFLYRTIKDIRHHGFLNGIRHHWVGSALLVGLGTHIILSMNFFCWSQFRFITDVDFQNKAIAKEQEAYLKDLKHMLDSDSAKYKTYIQNNKGKQIIVSNPAIFLNDKDILSSFEKMYTYAWDTLFLKQKVSVFILRNFEGEDYPSVRVVMDRCGHIINIEAFHRNGNDAF